MNWSDVSRLVGKAAPLVGGILAGPAGAAVGGLLAEKLGVPGTAADVAAAIQADATTLLRIKELESTERTRLAELQAQVELGQVQAEAADRASARDREAKVHDMTPAILAYGVTLGFFGTLATAIFHGLPADGGEAILVLLGSLGTAWTAIVSYYYGSTRGSEAKTALLVKKP
jgi:hypothetical protein